MAINFDEFSLRRQRLIKVMGEGVAIIPTSPELIRNRDSHYPYRFDSYFYYLSAFKEPESVLFIIAGAHPKTVLFCRDKDMERDIWDGFRYGPAGAVAEFGFDEAYSIAKLDEIAPKLLANQEKLFYSFGAEPGWDLRVNSWLNHLRSQARTGTSVPDEVVDVRKHLDEMRLYKSAYEIEIMRHSSAIAAGAHQRAMKFVKPGLMEYEVEAEFLHEFYRCGAQSPAYASIVAGGRNACTLHYNLNNAKLCDGDLLLIDAGCELDGYASDITRTFPISGKFSSAQKDLYEMVLASQAAAIAKVLPDEHWNAPHEAALDVLIRGFIDFGLCKGSPEEVLESGSYRQFYMHRTGHWLGLDVHDAGEYKDKQGNWRIFKKDMALTVEPGCYVVPSDKVPKHFWNIGIRIEDDVVVTESGCEVITKGAPKTVFEIEELMQDA